MGMEAPFEFNYHPAMTTHMKARAEHRPAGRMPREIRRNGDVQCSKCKEWKNISGFYCRGVYVLVPNDRGVLAWHGKPNSWCRSCQSEYQREVYIGPCGLPSISPDVDMGGFPVLNDLPSSTSRFGPLDMSDPWEGLPPIGNEGDDHSVPTRPAIEEVELDNTDRWMLDNIDTLEEAKDRLDDPEFKRWQTLKSKGL